MQKPDFQEIAHCGGKVKFSVRTTPGGRRQLQIGIEHCAPNAAAFFAVYAIPQGVAVGTSQLGGIGEKSNPPPIPGCYQVFIASDSEGMFGCNCPDCVGYWRTRGGAVYCPYCGIRAERHQFLTGAQQHYVFQYCNRLSEALDTEEDGDHVIDMDAVADATGKDVEKPPFYYAEESQQTQFTCESCGRDSDILGTYGYCSTCGSRNDLQQLDVEIERLRVRINGDEHYEACTKDAVALFDSFTNQLAKQLLQNVPMTLARRHSVEKRSLHNLNSIAKDFRNVFGIDVLSDVTEEDAKFAALMFHRRHVYEHNGGEADEKYIAESGDNAVRPKQTLRETAESAHRLASLVRKMASNLHRGFHEIFPPDEAPIRQHTERKKYLDNK